MNTILDKVKLAREHARLENYDTSLRCYEQAVAEINQEIENTTVSTELSRWKAILKDISAEQAAISRIKTAVDRAFLLMEQSTDHDPSDEDEGPIEVDDGLPQWTKDVPRQTPRQLRQPAGKRPVVGPAAKPARGVAGRPAAGSRVGNDVKRPPARPPKGGKQPAGGKHSAPPQSSAPERPALDPSTDPLVQQIVDMGILIREPNVQWESIAGLTQVKRLLRQNLVILPMRPDIAKGLLAPWKSVLFYGPPGTGKTFLAKAVATECKRTFFNVTSATITSRFLGESEKLVSHLFNLAQQMAPATIFFDEIDSIASQRGGANENEASRRMKAQLLTALEGIDGVSDESKIFVLAATNFPWDLDEALLRRFQKRIYIPLPDVEGRLSILKMTLGELVDPDEFDMDGWAKKLEGYSCADVTNLCRDAVQQVFERQMEQLDDTQDFMSIDADAIKVQVKDQDFAAAVSSRKSSVNPETLKRYEEWRKTKGAE